jgi:Bacterial low temperature requirement A protein (LtrA)
VRGILIALYLRASHHEARARLLTRRLLAAFIAGGGLWLASMVALVATGMASRLHVAAAVTAVLCFVIAVCLRWLYFEFLDSSPLRRGVLASLAYSYGHLLLSAGVTTTGVGALLAIESRQSSLEDGPCAEAPVCSFSRLP